jgi:hypothetical protein
MKPAEKADDAKPATKAAVPPPADEPPPLLPPAGAKDERSEAGKPK